MRQFGWNRLIEDQGKSILGEHVNIIQHPNGEPKQLALRENQLVDVLEDFVHYETDTAPGSSGSPVFNDQWEVVALHHSGVPRRDDQGRILTRDGALWTSDMGEHRIGWVGNEGARVSRIVQHIKDRSLATDLQRRLRSEMFETDPATALQASHRRAGEAAYRSATVHSASSPMEGEDGAAVWTLPLQVSVHLGQSLSPSQTGEGRPPSSLPGRIGGAASAGLKPQGNRAADPEDDGRLREALAELEAARSRPYYEQEKDRRDRDAYYGDVPESLDEGEFFEWLSGLLRCTHANQPRYAPSRHLYPWVELHPDLKLRSVYSGREFDR